ncbi:MAG: cytochrome c [Acidobacteriia bacterium]|nr:cytochrome c [Terriglobia bacterium]
MKRIATVTALLAFLLIPVLLVAGPQSKGDAKAGKEVYDKKCATCHGPNGEGKPALAKALKVEIRHLGSKEVQAKSDEVLAKESSEGVGKMGPVKGLTEKDIADVVAYIRSLKKE